MEFIEQDKYRIIREYSNQSYDYPVPSLSKTS